MIKSRYFVYSITMMTILLFLFGTLVRSTPANAVQIETPTPSPTSTSVVSRLGVVPSAEEQEELKNIVQSYVEIRYRALSVSDPGSFPQNDFGNLISETPQAKVFLSEELGKLAVEIKRADLNQLRYIDYKYSLDFRSITIDPSTQIATIVVVEGREVVYELSVELRPENPIVSRTAGIEHTIILHKINGQWKIISDTYNDDLWRMLRHAGKSTDEILFTIDEMVRLLEASPRSSATRTDITETVTAFALADDPSSHDYLRNGVIRYAFEHWSKDDGLYNPDYPEYSKDCQNFVSQALYEEGNASMFIPDPLPTPSEDGQSGWYLLNDMQRASAWNDVEAFYTFVTNTSWIEAYTPGGEYYGEGPEGTLLLETDGDEVPAGLMEGDVIQFEWPGTPDDNGPLYDHSAIVVNIVDGEPYLAAHTTDHAYEPLTNFMPWEKIRFIHIERSNGYPPVNTRIATSSDDAGTNPGSCAFSSTDNEVYLGSCFGGGDITGGFRFDDIHIPQGAYIKYAYLIFTVDGDYSVPIATQIYGETDTAPGNTFTVSNPPERRATTDTAALWVVTDQIIDFWKLGMRRSPPDLKTLVQEIVQGSGWSPGNTLSFIFKNAGSTAVRRVIALERPEPHHSPARLLVAYSLEDPAPNLPTVQSITRASPNPTGAASVDFTVTFSEPVTGVGIDDFALTTVGVSGAAVSGVSGGNDTYTVSVGTGSGNGVIRLEKRQNYDNRYLNWEGTSLILKSDTSRSNWGKDTSSPKINFQVRGPMTRKCIFGISNSLFLR